VDHVEGGAFWPVVAFLALLAVIVHEIHRRLGRPLSTPEWLGVLFAAVVGPAAWIVGDGVNWRSTGPSSRASTSRAA